VLDVCVARGDEREQLNESERESVDYLCDVLQELMSNMKPDFNISLKCAQNAASGDAMDHHTASVEGKDKYAHWLNVPFTHKSCLVYFL
jgi:hypothetical protein